MVAGMLDECEAEIERSNVGLTDSLVARKKAEDALQSTEEIHAGEVSRLESQIRDLERDLGKSASALFKSQKEKKKKVSELRRFQREVQQREESEAARLGDGPLARLSKVAILLESLVIAHERDLALAAIEGGLSEARLFKDSALLSAGDEELRLLSCQDEIKAPGEDFVSIVSQLRIECGPAPGSGGSGGLDPAPGGDKVEDAEKMEEGSGDMVPDPDAVVDEGGAPKSA